MIHFDRLPHSSKAPWICWQCLVLWNAPLLCWQWFAVFGVEMIILFGQLFQFFEEQNFISRPPYWWRHHVTNLIRFCSVFIGLVLWLRFFVFWSVFYCRLMLWLLLIIIIPCISSAQFVASCLLMYKEGTTCVWIVVLLIQLYEVASSCSFSQRSYGQHHFNNRTPSATKKWFFRIIIICTS